VSLEITRSRFIMIAAESRNASGPASKSAPSACTGMSRASGASCSTPSFFCRLISLTLGTLPNGAKARSGIERPLSIIATGFPCHTIPTQNGPAGSRFA
jgi:hypothetical protein